MLYMSHFYLNSFIYLCYKSCAAMIIFHDDPFLI